MAGSVTRAIVFVAVVPRRIRLFRASPAIGEFGRAAEEPRGAVGNRLVRHRRGSTVLGSPRPCWRRRAAKCDSIRDNSVMALLTTTEVGGGKSAWEITWSPKDQVSKRIAAITSAQSATCDSGLDGRPGEWALCHVTRNGVALNQVVEIKDVRGLARSRCDAGDSAAATRGSGAGNGSPCCTAVARPRSM